MSEEVFENPALNPTRRWEDSVDVRNELSFIVHGSTPVDRIDFLRELVEVGEMQLSDSRSRDLAKFFNKVATAFGFVPMIEFSGESCWLTPEVVAPLRTVLSPAYRPGE
ncbi:hypothetical protein [Amycolatopsis viridis]|uniref:Uncharacterized protein n=1 Tax=Amycolatopsis viridis TaxID=185678 RepID=A0ABX0SWT9_9PSEU|nr:hypothetical protein [Amycolatopsis viridis]NIH80129.1 hypothetical protein [Amycolatopsis viridis]